jgi:hypothetical protein
MGDPSIMVPLSKDSFLTIMEQFHLPYPYLQSLFTGTARSMRYADHETHYQSKYIGSLHYCLADIVYRTPISRTENWALSFTLHKPTGIIKGLLLGIREEELDTFRQYLLASKRELPHPMYLPLILCEMQTNSDTTEVKRHSSSLFEIELWTQMHAYDFAELYHSPGDIDYNQITKELNGIISRLAFHQMRLETTLKSLDYMKGCEKHFRPAGHGPDGLGNDPHLLDIAESLADRIEQTSDENRVLLEEVRCNQRIAQSQLDAVRSTSRLDSG